MAEILALHFEHVAGFFKHELQPVGPDSGFRATTLPGFGICARTYSSDETIDTASQWKRLEQYLGRLNAGHSSGERYKVLFVARHGEGVHNVKEREVGRLEWERYWSRIDGDEQGRTWADPVLTEKGVQQAEELGKFWEAANAEDGVPLPTSFFVSPLRRCLQTAQATWTNLLQSHGLGPFRFVVVEALREISGVHTCDRRSSQSELAAFFPEAIFEQGFTEHDELWQADRRETQQEHALLWTSFLHKVFASDPSMFISITTHSGASRALFHAIGHPDIWLAAGATVPVLIKSSMVSGTNGVNLTMSM